MEKHRTDGLDALCRAILSLQTAEECEAFLDDLCTIRELQDMSQRYAVAMMLDGGSNYQDISRATGASTATISRVNKCLNYGSQGYRTVLSRGKEEPTDETP